MKGRSHGTTSFLILEFKFLWQLQRCCVFNQIKAKNPIKNKGLELKIWLYLEELDVCLNVLVVDFALFDALELFKDFALDHGDAVLLDHLRVFYFLNQILERTYFDLVNDTNQLYPTLEKKL